MKNYDLKQSGAEVQELLDQVPVNKKEIERLKQLYAGLSKTNVEIVASLPSVGVANTIYRVAGSDGYADYMFDADDLSTAVLLATYGNGIDEEPTEGSENLVKSGGVKKAVDEVGYYAENNEYIRAYTDAEGRFLWGIKPDGSIEWAKGVPTPVKEWIEENVAVPIKDLMEENAQALTGSIATKVDKEEGKGLVPNQYIEESDNPEYVRVITDSEGRTLCGIKKDGGIYFGAGVPEQVKEYIMLTQVELEESKELVKSIYVEEDPEERAEIKTDSDGKILSYRDKEGVLHESKQYTEEASFGKMNLSSSNAKDIEDALKSNGFTAKSPIDWSDEEYIELPIPRVAASVNIIADSLATSKTEDKECFIEYSDKEGNYFKKAIILNAQGSSSMGYFWKNQAFDFVDCKIKFGHWVSQDSFHIKKYYIDAFRGQCIVAYKLMEQVYQTRGMNNKPWKYLQKNPSLYDSNGDIENDVNTGALAHPDGFPINIYLNGELQGLYVWALKKHRDNYFADKKTAENIILDGVIDDNTLWGGSVAWNQFEIRNPKDLVDINGKEYDGENPTELSDTDKLSKTVKSYIERLSKAKSLINSQRDKNTFEQYFLPDFYIDYYLISQVIYHVDGFRKNWIWCTWDGNRWAPTLYDCDSIFGSTPNGTFVERNVELLLYGGGCTSLLKSIYKDDINNRYKELRKNIFTVENIIGLLKEWEEHCGYDNIKNDRKICNETPSYRDSKLNRQWEPVKYLWGSSSSHEAYSPSKQYNIGDICVYENYEFKAIENVIGVQPLTETYNLAPNALGYYNSVQRVENWLTERIKYLDNQFEYNV